MNDRVSAFCAGVGAAGLLLLTGWNPTMGAVFGVYAGLAGVILIGIGVADWWLDRRRHG